MPAAIARQGDTASRHNSEPEENLLRFASKRKRVASPSNTRAVIGPKVIIHAGTGVIIRAALTSLEQTWSVYRYTKNVIVL